MSRYFVVLFIIFLSPIFLIAGLENNLEEWTNIHGASGFEGEIRESVRKAWTPLTKKIVVDDAGNLLAQANEFDKTRPTILLMVHLDEVGLFVKEVTHNGYVLFGCLGGWHPSAIPAQEWIISTPQGPLLGYSGMDDMSIPEEKTSKIFMDQYFIDIGVKSKKEALEKGIRPGLPITPNTEYKKLGNCVFAKALDDRAGLAVITQVLTEHKSKYNLFVAATVQEEVGCRGASMVYQSLKEYFQVQKINKVLNVDAGRAQDFPTPANGSSTPRLGSGPAFCVFDESMIPDQKLLNDLIQVADTCHIPYQFESQEYAGQDGSALQCCGTGIPTINISIPCRYAHSHGSMMSLEDIERTSSLLLEYLKTEVIPSSKPRVAD